MSKVIILHRSDNVGTAVAELSPGDRVETDGSIVTASEPIPFGHKIALTAIKAGEVVLKYGESIGLARGDIAQGGCVHTHNVDSQRGRGDLGDRA